MKYRYQRFGRNISLHTTGRQQPRGWAGVRRSYKETLQPYWRRALWRPAGDDLEHSAIITYKVEADRVRIVNVFYGGRDFEAFYLGTSIEEDDGE